MPGALTQRKNDNGSRGLVKLGINRNGLPWSPFLEQQRQLGGGSEMPRATPWADRDRVSGWMRDIGPGGKAQCA